MKIHSFFLVTSFFSKAGGVKAGVKILSWSLAFFLVRNAYSISIHSKLYEFVTCNNKKRCEKYSSKECVDERTPDHVALVLAQAILRLNASI